MEFLKIFPTLFLDLISKIVPGFSFLIVFQNQYLPPSEIILRLFQPQTLPADWLSSYRVVMILITSYFMGVVIAILANLAEGRIVAKRWYPRMKGNPGHFLSSEDQLGEILKSLDSPEGLVQFLDRCRDYISVINTSAAALLERYRTCFRLFFGLTLLFIAIPLGQRTLQSMLSFIGAPIFGAATYYMSRRYFCKTLQLYAVTKTNAAKDEKKAGPRDWRVGCSL